MPLPPAVVACVKRCAEAAPLTPDALRTAMTRLLLCAQWPAGDEDVLQLLPHEAAALTWCATPAVWVKSNRFLSGLPSKRPANGSLDSILYSSNVEADLCKSSKMVCLCV